MIKFSQKTYKSLFFLGFLSLTLFGLNLSNSLEAQTDAGIIEVISPQAGFDCSGATNIAPEFVIGNTGQIPIALLFYTVTVDGEELITSPITNIPVGESTTVSLDPVEVGSGDHTVVITIDNVNGSADANPNNNVETVEVEYAEEGGGFTVLLDVAGGGGGGGGADRSYSLIASDGTVVDEIEELDNNSEYELPYCLPVDCYSIVLTSTGNGNGGVDAEVVSDAGYTIVESPNWNNEILLEFCTDPPVDLAAGLVEMVTPSDGEQFCANVLLPSFVLSNQGLNPLTSANFEYELADETYSFEWTGNLGTFEEIEISLPIIETLDLGTNTFNVNLISINETPYLGTEGALSSNFDILEGTGFTVFIDVAGGGGGGGGAQRTYALLDENGNVIDEINPLQNNSEFELSYCLEEGCFSIVTTSSAGNPNANGGVDFIVAADAGYVIVESPDFWSGENTVEFCSSPPANSDAAITEILNPVDGESLCSESIAPIFTLTNLGLSTLTSANIEYELGDQTGTYEWTGNLANFEAEEVSLPLIENINAGNNTLTINIVEVNGTSDEDDSNNSQSVSFETVAGVGFTVFLEVDGGPGFIERFYTISDGDGNVIESFLLENGDDYELDYCFEEGCFSILLEDGFGVGGVEFEVIANAGYIVAQSEDFTETLTTNFCTSPPLNLDANLSGIVYPTDGDGICGGAFTPIITINNVGFETLTSASIEYEVGEQINTYEWSGDLEQFESEEIELPNLSGFDIGDATFTATIVSTNGQTDDNTENDAQSVELAFIEGDGMVLTLEVGDGFQSFGLNVLLTDLSGNTILEQGGFNENTDYFFNICEEPGCFVLNLTNAFGGGGGPGGGDIDVVYTLSDNSGNVILEGEDVDGDGVEQQFCSPNAEISSYDVGLLYISNPDGEEPICGTQYTPTIGVINIGSETVTNLSIDYGTDIDNLETYEWSGNLGQFEEIEIDLPAIGTSETGNYFFYTSIVTINGESDEDYSNNIENVSYEVIDAESATLSINPTGGGGGGGFGFIAYVLSDENGNVIDELEGVPEDFELDLCLPIGCYELEVFNVFGQASADFSIENGIGVTLVEDQLDGDDITVEFCTIPLDLESLDAGVNAILAPSGALCSTLISPSLEFINNGLEPITSIEFEYDFDGNIMLSENWTGNISTYETAVVDLEELSGFSFGAHEFSINILTVNGQQDDNTTDNSVVEGFTILDAETFTLNLQADFSPQENSFQIIDDLDNVLFEGGQGTFTQPFAINTADFCLSPGCYTLILLDELGDGGSSVSIVNEAGDVLGEGTSEGASLSVPFCIEAGPDGTGLNDLTETAQIELFPNPTNGTFYLKHNLVGNYQVLVQDLLGRTLIEQNLNSGQNTIQMGETLPNGMYLLTVENGESRGVYKVVLER